MFTESKVTQIFCIADDFCKEVLVQPFCGGNAALLRGPDNVPPPCLFR